MSGFQQEVTPERIAAMVSAGKSGGATPQVPLAAEHVDDLEPVDSPAEEASPEGQQPQADPIAKLKAEYEAKLAETQEELKNVKAQVATSHKRNGEASRDRQLAEELARKSEETSRRAEEALRRTEAMANGIFAVNKLPPDIRDEVLRTWNEPSGDPRQFQIGNPPPPQREDPRVAQLLAKVDTLERNVNGYAFEVNAGAVAAAIERQVIGNPAFELAEKLGEMDNSRERIWQAFVQFDQENKGAVSPHNPRQINDAVKKLVDAEGKRWKRINDETIKNYREKRKALNAQAGAPTRGPSANVRAAPQPTGPSAGESPKQREARWKAQMEQVTKQSRNGGRSASEV